MTYYALVTEKIFYHRQKPIIPSTLLQLLRKRQQRGRRKTPFAQTSAFRRGKRRIVQDYFCHDVSLSVMVTSCDVLRRAFSNEVGRVKNIHKRHPRCQPGGKGIQDANLAAKKKPKSPSTRTPACVFGKSCVCVRKIPACVCRRYPRVCAESRVLRAPALTTDRVRPKDFSDLGPYDFLSQVNRKLTES